MLFDYFFMLPFIFEVGIKKNLTNLQFYRYFSSISSNNFFKGPFETIGQEPDAVYTNNDRISSIFGHVLETLQFNMFENAYLDLVVVREE
jgi:hypothetical protein